jgi:hypothetical protein
MDNVDLHITLDPSFGACIKAAFSSMSDFMKRYDGPQDVDSAVNAYRSEVMPMPQGHVCKSFEEFALAIQDHASIFNTYVEEHFKGPRSPEPEWAFQFLCRTGAITPSYLNPALEDWLSTRADHPDLRCFLTYYKYRREVDAALIDQPPGTRAYLRIANGDAKMEFIKPGEGPPPPIPSDETKSSPLPSAELKPTPEGSAIPSTEPTAEAAASTIPTDDAVLQPVFSARQETLSIDLSCVICLEAARNSIILPCNHLCCCKDCGLSLEHCPICRASIVSLHPVFIV